MTAQFRLVQITTTDRPLVGYGRVPLHNTDNSIVGDTPGGDFIFQWMDPELYQGWVTYARQQLNAAVQNRDPVAMQNASKAIMAAYNAANIPWWIDPQARVLHQTFIAGPPQDPRDPSEFAANQLYNSTVWLAPNQNRCIRAPVSFGTNYGGCNSDDSNNGSALPSAGLETFSGVLPILARSRFTQLVSPSSLSATIPIQYLPRLQFVLRVPSGADSKLDSSFWPQSDPHVPLPFDLGLFAAPLIYNDVLWRTEPKQHYRHANGTDAANAPDGWDVTAFDTGATTTVPEQLRLSYADYAPYLSAWISALESRTPAELVQDARTYAMYRNAISVQLAGSSTQLAGGAIQNVDTLTTPNASVQMDLRLIGTGAGLAGAALAVPTFGISALIGGAVTAVTSLASAYVSPDLSRVYIDDLERPKPWIERSWLGGSPAAQSTDAGVGPPALQNIPDPPGWTRPRGLSRFNIQDWTNISASVRQAIMASPQTFAPAPPPPPDQLAAFGTMLSGVPEWVWLVGGLVLGGGALYGGYRLTQSRQGPSKAPARRSSNRRSRGRA